MPHISYDHLQVNDDGTPRRKHDIEEQKSGRPGLYSVTGFVIFQIIALIKQFWFDDEQQHGSNGHVASGVAKEASGPRELRLVEPTIDSGEAKPSDKNSIGSETSDGVRGSGLKNYAKTPDLYLDDRGAIETAKLGAPLAPPVNDNFRLYGALPGEAIRLTDDFVPRGSGSIGTGGGGTQNSGGDGRGPFTDAPDERDVSGNGDGGSNSGGTGGQGPGAGGVGTGGAGSAGLGGSGSTGSSGGDQQGSGTGNRLPSVSSVVLLSALLINESQVLAGSDLLQHVSDPDGDVLQVSNIKASSGHVIATSSGEWLYIPEFNDRAVVQLTYSVSDGTGSITQSAFLPIVALPHAPLTGSEAVNHLAPIVGEENKAHIVEAGGGYDTVQTGTGDDIVYGGDGDDRIETGSGNDAVFAGAGNDTVLAGDGDDVVFGEEGDDYLDGQDGRDYIEGGAGSDVVLGGGGDDILNGGSGDDQVFGGDGHDRIVGETDDGADVMSGGDGHDLYIAAVHDGDDVFAGGDGDDVFFAANADGNDLFEGGEGQDVYRSAANDGQDTFRGGAGDDTFLAAAAGTADGSSGTEGGNTALPSTGGSVDVFDGGEGVDTYDASAVGHGLLIDLNEGAANILVGPVEMVPQVAVASEEQPIGPTAASLEEPADVQLITHLGFVDKGYP
ncbi:MAG: cadherin-like domain-containing protein [Hyphomicrobium sp.]|nr:cadherin-like domain-containing protein [Hyphomicrobium sp.]